MSQYGKKVFTLSEWFRMAKGLKKGQRKIAPKGKKLDRPDRTSGKA